MNMGSDNSLSFALEAFDELWPLEDHSSTVAPTYTEINHLNPWRELDFSPHLEQGISVLAEEFSNIKNDGSRGNSFSTGLIESSSQPNMFGEQYSDTLYNNTCTSRVENDLNANTFTEQERSIVADYLSTSVRKGFSSKKRERKPKIKHVETERRELVENEGEEQSLAKKQDHNVKERVRRMKLHASYLALGSLLPISGTSKKRWTSQVIIDKVLEYIPELEKEIQQLTMKKNSILSITENRRLLVNKKSSTDSEAEAALIVSVNEIRKSELILQICRKRDIGADNVFSNFLRSIEDEGICIVSASTIHVCEERECYHIHIQVKESGKVTILRC